MNGAEGMLIAAGGLALAGNAVEAKTFPSNGVNIIAATIALVLIASMASRTALAGPVKALAALMLLVSVYLYVPAFTKGKNHG